MGDVARGGLSALLSLMSGSVAAADEPAPPVDTAMGAGLGLQQDVHPQADTVCPAGETLFGIDVSKWQGQIDWAAVAGDGVNYAIIRTTHGLNITDEWFETNWEQAKAHGIVRGVYQYFEPAQDPIAQADLMLAMMGDLQPGDLPPVIDVESATDSTPAQTAAAVRDWVDHVQEATGMTPIIYTGRYFWQDNVQSDDFLGNPLWIAHYTTGCPNIPAPWTTWTFHQYSSTGSVAGIAGDVDTNTFNGNLADLMALTKQDLQPPSGGFDAAGCDAVRGYAIDPAAGGPAEVVVSFDGAADDANALVVTTTASLPHGTACDESGCDHGFEVAIPWALLDGEEHAVHVTLAANDGLVVAPTAIGCDADLTGVRLRPITSAAMTAWGFDAKTDVLALAVDKAPEPDDEPFPDAPLVVTGETVGGTWWIDRGTRRAVDPEAAIAWGITEAAVMTWPDDSVEEIPEGDPLPSQRRAVELEGVVYVVDGEVAEAGDGDDDSGSDPDGGDGNADDDAADDDGDGDDPGMLPGAQDEDDGGGGCAIASAQHGRALLLLLLPVLTRSGRSRRRRRAGATHG